jgi:Mycothiol maleylpyruvate isomerase N-terminal domain
MGRREDLLRQEAGAWGRIDGVVESLSAGELVRPGYTVEGWSAKDMMAHIAAWSNVAAGVLREISAGTWSGHHASDEPGGTDRLNAEWFERDRELDVDTVRFEWHASRTRMLEAFGALDEISSGADEWFEESGPSHYAEHLPDLERWVRRMRSER